MILRLPSITEVEVRVLFESKGFLKNSDKQWILLWFVLLVARRDHVHYSVLHDERFLQSWLWAMWVRLTAVPLLSAIAAPEVKRGKLWGKNVKVKFGFTRRTSTGAHMPRLDEACSEDYECQMRVGPRGVCRKPPDMCKCQTGYYIKEDKKLGKKDCVKCKFRLREGRKWVSRSSSLDCIPWKLWKLWAEPA